MNDFLRKIIVERVLLLHRNRRTTDNGIIFLAMEPDGKRNPSTPLLKILVGLPYNFKPISQARITPNGVYFQQSRKSSCVLSFLSVKYSHADHILVEGEVYRWGRDATTWIVRLQRVESKWQVNDAKITGVA